MMIPDQPIPFSTSWYDILDTEGTSVPVSFRNNQLYSIQQRQHWGRGLRVNIDGRTGFSYTSDPAALRETAEKARAVAPYGDRESFELPLSCEASFEPFEEQSDGFDISVETGKCSEAIAAILARFPRAVVDIDIGNYVGSMRLRNSRGLDCTYRRSSYSASLNVTLTMEDGTRIEVYETLSALAPRPIDALPGVILDKIENALRIAKAPIGSVPVLLTPGAFASMVRILTAGCNARSVWKGISPFRDKLGSALFHPSLTVRDAPCDPGSPYGFPFDDEGVAARNKPVVEKGTLLCFITDLKHAERLGIEAQGNASRGFSSLPMPSFGIVDIDPGDTPHTDLMKISDRMVLADQFLGLGQSNTLNGDFSVNLDLAYLVEKGEITGRVKDCMMSGNLFDLLGKEILLSRERMNIGSVRAPWLFLPSAGITGG